MSYTLKDSVLNEIDRLFPPRYVAQVRLGLESQRLVWEESACVPRVHIGILWASKGKLDKFQYELDGVGSDWREVLVAAGLANDDWKDVLRSKEIDCEDW